MRPLHSVDISLLLRVDIVVLSSCFRVSSSYRYNIRNLNTTRGQEIRNKPSILSLYREKRDYWET